MSSEKCDNITVTINEKSKGIPKFKKINVTEKERAQPEYGWGVKQDHQFEWAKGKPVPNRPSVWQIFGLLGLAYRMARYTKKIKDSGHVPFMDPMNSQQIDPFRGAPLGGLGSTIGRSWKGEFNKWQIHPGIYTYDTIWANQFIVRISRGEQTFQTVLCASKPENGDLSLWNWDFDGKNGTYHVLYPRSWNSYSFPEQKIELVCRTISPFIPKNYKDSSLPSTVFDWEVRNFGDDDVTVTIALSWQNGCSPEQSLVGGHENICFSSKVEGGDVVGVELIQKSEKRPYSFSIACLADSAAKAASHCTQFSTNGTGIEIWEYLKKNGKLDSEINNDTKSKKGDRIGAAVALTTTIKAKASESSLRFSIAWDTPTVVFGFEEEKPLYRRYTDFFGVKGDASPFIALYSVLNSPFWEAEILNWQNTVLNDPDLPPWYKGALFNESYFLADGGTVWTHSTDDFPDGKFLYLEGHEYRMYNTYDVHFYASWALLSLFPKLELSLQLSFAKTVPQVDDQEWYLLCDGNTAEQRAVKGSVPHDLGDPDESPWEKLNCYNLHDTSHWKDLNCKYILQVFRDYQVTNDRQFLEKSWDAMKMAMKFLLKYDKDGDGMIENENFPDQTYDVWLVDGISAYCGGLWLAAAQVMISAGEILGDSEEVTFWKDIFQRGQTVYDESLWNGEYYNYDCSNSKHNKSIQADQMAGHWWLKAMGLESYSTDEKAKTALTKVYNFNCLKFANGEMGCVNGMTPSGVKDSTSMQSEECWTGVTFGVAAAMIQEGMTKEGFQAAKGVCNYVYENGLAFQTPEGYYDTGAFRSLSYMRPLCIWAIQSAWEKKKKS